MGRITGERVTLREFRQEDISAIRSWVTDSATTSALGGVYMRPQTWEQSERYLSSLLEGDAGGINLVIADKSTLRYMGQCSLMMVDQTARHAEQGRTHILITPQRQGDWLPALGKLEQLSGSPALILTPEEVLPL